MDPLLRRAVERRKREAAEQLELEDKRPKCEICETHLYPTRKCRKTGRFDSTTRCIECLDIKEVRREKPPPAPITSDLFFTEDEIECYVKRLVKNPGEDEDWSLYQELMAKEEDRPEPAST